RPRVRATLLGVGVQAAPSEEEPGRPASVSPPRPRARPADQDAALRGAPDAGGGQEAAHRRVAPLGAARARRERGGLRGDAPTHPRPARGAALAPRSLKAPRISATIHV